MCVYAKQAHLLLECKLVFCRDRQGCSCWTLRSRKSLWVARVWVWPGVGIDVVIILESTLASNKWKKVATKVEAMLMSSFMGDGRISVLSRAHS